MSMTAPVREGPAPIGDNSMHAHEDMIAELERGLEVAAKGGVTTEARAALVRDLGKAAHDYLAELDRDFRDRKAPHEAAINKLKGLFNPLSHRVGQVKEGCRTLLTAWLQAERVRREREAEAEALKAKAAQDAADKARELARADTAGPWEGMDARDAEHEAEVAQVDADYARRVADARPSVSSASGVAKAASLRVTWGAALAAESPLATREHSRKLAHHYRDRAEVIELCLKLASAEMRASKGQAKIPGVKAVSTEKAV